MSTRGSEISAVAWVARGELSPQEWAAAGRKLGAISRASQWWIGDWIQYGNQKWGEKYVQAARLTGYDVASLRNMAWVASQFDVLLRNNNLTWSHHALLAPLERDQKKHWLNEAASRRLSVADLRVELRSLRAGKMGELPAKQKRSRVQVEDAICPNCGHRLPLVD